MAFFDSNVSTFTLDDTGGTPRIISPSVNDVSGLPGARPVSPVTALGDTGVKHQPTIEDVSFSISGTYDNSATTGADVVLAGVRTHTAALTFSFSPDGTIVYSGECWCIDYVINSSVGNIVSFTASFVVEGVVSRA